VTTLLTYQFGRNEPLAAISPKMTAMPYQSDAALRYDVDCSVITPDQP
jgi:hypothetical protein